MSVIPAGGTLSRRTGLFGLAAFVAIVAPWPWSWVAVRVAIVRYLRALARLALVLVPECLLVVLLAGALVAGGVVACAVPAGALLWLVGG